MVGHGFIGRRIARLAHQRGWQVRALSRRAAAGSALPYEQVAGDAADPMVMSHVLDGVSHVVLAAGTVKPAESNVHPLEDFRTNLAPLLNTLETMVRRSVPDLTFLSSAGTVYGPQAGFPTSEDAPMWPISSYGIQKVAAERYVSMYAQQFGFSADILRCSNVYGPGEPHAGSQGLIGVARTVLRENRSVALYGDGSARRDFVHVDDVADVVERLATKPDGVRVLNVGSGESVAIRDIIDTLATSLGVEPVIDHRPARPTDVPVVQLDISRIRSLLDFQPRDVRTALLDAGDGEAAGITSHSDPAVLR